MGRTPKPLQMLIDPLLLAAAPETFQELTDQGHLIVAYEDAKDYVMSDFDAILGCNARRMTPDLLKHLPLAIRGARDLRYKSKSKPGV